jgi:hypothetical protein
MPKYSFAILRLSPFDLTFNHYHIYDFFQNNTTNSRYHRATYQIFPKNHKWKKPGLHEQF